MEDEKFLTSYINAFTAVFRAAPASVAKTVGGPSGIFLMVDGNPVPTTEKSQSRRASQSHRESPKTRHDGDSSRISSPGGGGGGSDGEFLFVAQNACSYMLIMSAANSVRWCTAWFM